jgi:hypothetical protein
VPHTQKDLAAATNTAAPASQDDRLADIAEKCLDFFEHAAGAAREALGEDRRPDMNVLAVVNTLTAEKAVRNLENMNEEKRRELRVLSMEPAIARAVAEDEHGEQRTYFISRATPYSKPRDGSAAASYRAPIGTALPASSRKACGATRSRRWSCVIRPFLTNTRTKYSACRSIPDL